MSILGLVLVALYTLNILSLGWDLFLGLVVSAALFIWNALMSAS